MPNTEKVNADLEANAFLLGIRGLLCKVKNGEISLDEMKAYGGILRDSFPAGIAQLNQELEKDRQRGE